MVWFKPEKIDNKTMLEYYEDRKSWYEDEEAAGVTNSTFSVYVNRYSLNPNEID
jgi:hypothetical protein